MSRIHPEKPGPESTDWSLAADVLLRKEPDEDDEDEDDEGDRKKKEDGDEDDEDDGYSE
jgi:hypothetical protein